MLKELTVLKKIGFINWLKKNISRNIFFYKIWFYSVRKYRGDYVRLPLIDDHIYFDGYPRSGNTFFVNLVRRAYPNKRFTHHLHVISSLKIALNLGLPTFVIIRKPKDAVISYLYTKVVENKRTSLNHRLIESLLISYYKYYSFVKENIDGINILSFDLCINNELLLIHQIAKKAGFKAKSDNYLKEILDSYQKMMKKKEAQKESHASSLPNPKRMDFKKEYLSQVLNSSFYDMAKGIYDEIVTSDLLVSGEG